MSMRDYIIASFVGKFPSTGIEAIIGHDTITQQEDPTRLIVVVILAVLLIVGAWWYERKAAKKMELQELAQTSASLSEGGGPRSGGGCPVTSSNLERQKHPQSASLTAPSEREPKVD